ncbi:hypothetical protein MKX08_004592 [Trichoderma sp. CBMAI-0020]|nr:hypothetical protein MKX08_004592 [Trichoderma sp. CBMAI-0020]
MASMCLVHAPYMHSSSKFHSAVSTQMSRGDAYYENAAVRRTARITASELSTVASAPYSCSYLCMCGPTRLAMVRRKPWRYEKDRPRLEAAMGWEDRECGLTDWQPTTEVVRQDIHAHPVACKGSFAGHECHGPKSFLSSIPNGVLQPASTGELR